MGALPRPLPVSLHDAAEVGGLVGHVFQVRVQELSEDREGAICREFFESVEGSVVEI